MYKCLGEYGKAEEHLKKALVISQEIGGREGEAACYGNLGTLFRRLGIYAKTKEYIEKGLAVS